MSELEYLTNQMEVEDARLALLQKQEAVRQLQREIDERIIREQQAGAVQPTEPIAEESFVDPAAVTAVEPEPPAAGSC